MYKMLCVAWREFAAAVFTRGFLIGVLLPPLMGGLSIGLMPLLMNAAAPKVRGHVAVIDRSGVIQDRFAGGFTPEKLREWQAADINNGIRKTRLITEDQKKMIAEQAAKMPLPEIEVRKLDTKADAEAEKKAMLGVSGRGDSATLDTRLALVVIHDDASKPAAADGTPPYELFHAPKLDIEWIGKIKGDVGQAIVDARLEEGGLDAAKVKSLTRWPQVDAQAVTADGTVKTNEVAKILLPGAFMFLLWMSVFIAGQGLMTSTIEEKSSRVMEVLLSAVSPMQLLSGKILGQMGVGGLIMFAYGGVGMGSVIYFSLASQIDPMNLVYLGVYFIIAYSMIACMMAAVGSAVSDIREAQNLIGPIMIVLVIPMMLWLPILRNPNSMFAQVCSFIPPLSPFIMVLRLAGSEPVPAWQIPATIVLGFVYVYIFAWAAAKIFRIGVLMYGKPPNFSTLVRWIRMA
ncbi:MAG: ABC transporter permease [Planctomycetota bacterium]